MAQTSSRTQTLPVREDTTGWVRHCRDDASDEPFLTILERTTIDPVHLKGQIPDQFIDHSSAPVLPVIDRRRDPDAPVNLTFVVDLSLNDRLGALKDRKLGDYLLLPTDMETESLVLCEETDYGPCYTGDYFYTAGYPDPEGFQTTIAYWTREDNRPIQQGE